MLQSTFCTNLKVRWNTGEQTKGPIASTGRHGGDGSEMDFGFVRQCGRTSIIYIVYKQFNTASKGVGPWGVGQKIPSCGSVSIFKDALASLSSSEHFGMSLVVLVAILVKTAPLI